MSAPWSSGAQITFDKRVDADQAVALIRSGDTLATAGFVGVGGRAGRLLQYFSEQSDVEIVALAEIDQRRIPAAMNLLAERREKVPTRTWNRSATPPRSYATWPTSPGA